MKNRPTLLTLVAMCLMLVACDTKTKSVDSCGDGIIDPGEDCDQILGEATCGSLGHYNVNGVLACNSDCTFDLSDCGGRCGDGVIELNFNEECDAANLDGETCESLEYNGGTLACSAECKFDTTQCESNCGNGVIDEEEQCDGDDLGGATCEDMGFPGGTLVCSEFCQWDILGCIN